MPVINLDPIPRGANKQVTACACLFDEWNEEDLISTMQLAARIFPHGIAGIAIGGMGLTVMKVLDKDNPIQIFPELPLLAAGPLIVEDISDDIRFTEYLKSEPGQKIRFICSFQLLPASSTCLPVYLCISDTKVRSLSKKQVSELSLVARMGGRLMELAMDNLVLRKKEAVLRSNVEERMAFTAELDRQKEFYENILNKLPTDIAVFDANHKYLFVNPGAISVEEYRNFIIGKDDYEYAAYRKRDGATADTRREQFLRVKYTGKEIRWEDSMTRPDGQVVTHLRRMYPVHDKEGQLKFVIGFGIDITERKVLEEKQAVLVQQLSSQNTQLIDFCNVVSHNLRAPLVNISLLVDYIETATEPEEQLLLLAKLHPVIDHLNSTFNELVESIQIKQNPEIQSENIFISDCIRHTAEALESEINNTGAVIETDFSEAASLKFPPKYLYSIFYNLISNCLKYKSPARKPVIKIRCTKADGKALLSVTDNGLGIDLVKHSENFFKIGKVFHRHPNAKGFGLYMTKTKVEAMNSRIWAESTPDLGSTFFIEFSNQ